MTCAGASIESVYHVHQFPHAMLVNRIPGYAIDLQARTDNGAVGEAEQLWSIAGAEPGVDKHRDTGASDGLGDFCEP